MSEYAELAEKQYNALYELAGGAGFLPAYTKRTLEQIATQHFAEPSQEAEGKKDQKERLIKMMADDEKDGLYESPSQDLEEMAREFLQEWKIRRMPYIANEGQEKFRAMDTAYGTPSVLQLMSQFAQKVQSNGERMPDGDMKERADKFILERQITNNQYVSADFGTQTVSSVMVQFAQQEVAREIEKRMPSEEEMEAAKIVYCGDWEGDKIGWERCQEFITERIKATTNER